MAETCEGPHVTFSFEVQHAQQFRVHSAGAGQPLFSLPTETAGREQTDGARGRLDGRRWSVCVCSGNVDDKETKQKSLEVRDVGKT